MKHILFFVILLTALKLSAQTDTASAKVCFMRLPMVNAKSTLDLFVNQPAVTVDEKKICQLNEKRYTIKSFPVGVHEFNMQVPLGKNSINKVKPVTLELEAGRTYYIQLFYLYNGKWDNSYCKVLSEERAMMMMDDLKEDKSCKVEKRTEP